MAWDSYGVWQGSVEDAENYTGPWLIGDGFPEHHPGFIDSDDPRRRGLMVKHWRADAGDPNQTYCGDGHPRRIPAHRGRLEGVEVLAGHFYYECRGEVFCLAREKPRREQRPWKRSVELLPDEPGRWFLDTSSYASGVTICRYADRTPEHFGAGEGYEYHVVDTDSENLVDCEKRLCGPVALPDWSYQLIMVFRGMILNGSLSNPTHHVHTRDFAYAHRQADRQWYSIAQESRTIAAVMYY